MMDNDLISRLTDAEDDLARTLPQAGAVLTGQVRTATGRLRRARHVRETIGGAAAVAVLGISSWAAAGAFDGPPTPPATTTTPPPTVTEPAPTPSPDPSTPAPEVEAAPPTVREDTIDDATVLARLLAPRTGEVWVTPERAPEMDSVLSHEIAPLHAWRVGQRGGATIYVLVDGADAAAGQIHPLLGVTAAGLYEADADGIRAIACPSARASDACVDQTIITADVTRDEDTFYDTMTLPTQVDLGDGWFVTTTATTARGWYGQMVLGDGATLYDAAGEVRTVAELGAIDVVELVRAGEVPGMDDRRYALRLPLGTTVTLSGDDSPSGQFEHIRWDDGVDRALPDGGSDQSTAPGSGACFAGTFSVADDHVNAQWRAAGTTPGGHRVYVPVAGNPTATAVRAWHDEQSWTVNDEDPGYPYATDAEFLADHALYAIVGPDGQWQMRLRSDAVQVVYECA